MSDEALLLAAIREQPAEDTPRLVYADWLDEHGRGDQADYIRAKCRWDRRENCPDCRGVDNRLCDGCREAFRGADVPREKLRGWRNSTSLGPLPDGPHGDTPCGVIWHRGFPDAIGVPEEHFTPPWVRALLAEWPVRLVRCEDLRVRVEIKPPGAGSGWRVAFFRDGEDVPVMETDFARRQVMVEWLADEALAVARAHGED